MPAACIAMIFLAAKAIQEFFIFVVWPNTNFMNKAEKNPMKELIASRRAGRCRRGVANVLGTR
jgi:hypothetical protein